MFTIFHEGFLGPKLSVLTKFHLIAYHLAPKSLASRNYCSYLVFNKPQVNWLPLFTDDATKPQFFMSMIF